MKPKLSIVIPVLNEAERIVSALELLQCFRSLGHEIIVVDGGSQDTTCGLAQPLADALLVSMPGRATQMNCGASVAQNEYLLFLHADTLLPEGAQQLFPQVLASRPVWGRFNVRLSGGHPTFRVVETLMNWRSRLTGVATGDQAIFVRKDTFERYGPFPEIPLMEDVAFSKILRRVARPVCLHQRVLTSSRRWERAGIAKTIVLMWRLRLLYFFGVNPERLARLYREQ